MSWALASPEPYGGKAWPVVELATKTGVVAYAFDPEQPFGPRMTVEEWTELAEEVPGELLAGRLVEEEAPDYVHELIVAWLVRVLGNWAEENRAIVGGSEAKLALSHDKGRKPDATVYLAGRRPPRRGVIRIPPDIALDLDAMWTKADELGD